MRSYVKSIDHLYQYCRDLLNNVYPDFIIGNNYLLRWWIKKDDESCFYVHCIVDDDDDRALHDHPWNNFSFVVRGTLREVLSNNKHRILRPGDYVFRYAQEPHRLEVIDGPVWTLFFTGPRIREWGFYCPQGWRHWKDFVDPDNPGKQGRGCD